MSTLVPNTAPAPRPQNDPPGSQRPSGPGRRSSPWTWRWLDRLVLLCSWAAGITLCAIAGAIVLYMGYRGIQYLRPGLLFSRPRVSTSQAGSGGFLDPLLGN